MDTDLSKLKLCSFEEFCNMEDEERTIYQSIGVLLPYDDNGLGEAIYWQWGRVKEAMYILSQKNINYYQMVEALAVVMCDESNRKKKIAELFKKKWLNVWKLYNFVVMQLKEIAELESNTLGYEAESEREQEILSRLNRYGHFATLATLTNDNLSAFKDWETQPYKDVYTMLMLKKDRAEVEKELMKLKR